MTVKDNIQKEIDRCINADCQPASMNWEAGSEGYIRTLMAFIQDCNGFYPEYIQGMIAAIEFIKKEALYK